MHTILLKTLEMLSIVIDNCRGIMCSSNAVCVNGINTYECSCNDGAYSCLSEYYKMFNIIIILYTYNNIMI